MTNATRQLDPFGLPVSPADLAGPEPDHVVRAAPEARLSPQEREAWERYGNDFETAAEDCQ